MRKVNLIGELPMTPEIFSDIFQALKHGAIFVNAVREPLVVHHAPDRTGPALETLAADSLRSGPPPLGPARGVLAPHMAGATIRAVRNPATGVSEKVCRSFSGERRLHYR